MASLKELLDAISGREFLVLDTETTGTEGRAEPCSLAILRSDGGVLIDTYIRPRYPIPPAAEAVHQITNEQVRFAPIWPDLCDQIQKMLTGTIVLAYNAKFDRQMFHRAADNWGLPKVDWKTLSPWYCVMLAYAEFHGEINEYYGSFRWQKLASAIAQCGLEADKFHGALADCLATLDIVRYMQEHLPPGQQAHDAY